MAKELKTLNIRTAEALIQEQLPHLMGQKITSITGGSDHYLFQVGSKYVLRLPRSEIYAEQVIVEGNCLIQLKNKLSHKISECVFQGISSPIFPYSWSLLSWIDGVDVEESSRFDSTELAQDLSRFLLSLHSCPLSGSFPPSQRNFFRGGDLKVYDCQFRKALDLMKSPLKTHHLLKIWEEALASAFNGSSVWVHGDISPSNLILQKGRLKGIIDFGLVCHGDPACDLAIAWNYFSQEPRRVLLDTLGYDQKTVIRARAWALWKALVVVAGLSAPSKSHSIDRSFTTIRVIVEQGLFL